MIRSCVIKSPHSINFACPTEPTYKSSKSAVATTSTASDIVGTPPPLISFLLVKICMLVSPSPNIISSLSYSRISRRMAIAAYTIFVASTIMITEKSYSKTRMLLMSRLILTTGTAASSPVNSIFGTNVTKLANITTSISGVA